MAAYTIGIDFGTLSGRAVLVDVHSGEEKASSAFDYPHAVMDRALPPACGSVPLPMDWALEHPQDYLDVLTHTIPDVLRQSGVKAEEVIGVAVDFTASTLLPVRRDGTPLCFLPEYRENPHAWVKLWKHHAAQHLANRLTEAAQQRGEPWLRQYGGRVSSEWQTPKIWQVIEEAPEIYAAADAFIEATDWIVLQLTGVWSRAAGAAGYKGLWQGGKYPSEDFFASLDPRLARYTEEKFAYPLVQLGERVGGVTEAMAAATGLLPGTAVAAGNVDAHVTVPALGIERTGAMLAIMGTSTCHVLFDREEHAVRGMCGVVDGGVYPGYYGYEAGQSCVGDHFAWFIENCLPASYVEDAKRQGKNIYAYLREKADRLFPGESGLLALDWWNGNRSVLVDVDLCGMMLGMTLQTRPEEIYRALIEATAYGTRRIVEAFREGGVRVGEFYASGGISQKDPMTMQIYADVLGMPVRIAGTAQGPALGSAIFAAVAAGKEAGGYDDIFAAARAMGKVQDTVYTPIPERAAVYERLYKEYLTLHDYFGRGENDVMKHLRQIRRETLDTKA